MLGAQAVIGALLGPLIQLTNQLSSMTTSSSRRGTVTKMVETEHPHTNNEDWVKEIHIPGATSMSLKWDAKSSTEQNHDFVNVYRDSDESESVYPEFAKGLSGCAVSAWPPKIVQGTQRLQFKFQSDSSQVDWGFRCTITADVPDPVSLWRGTLAAQLSMTVTNLARSLCSASPKLTNKNSVVVAPPVEVPPVLPHGIVNNQPMSILDGWVKHYEADMSTKLSSNGSELIPPNASMVAFGARARDTPDQLLLCAFGEPDEVQGSICVQTYCCFSALLCCSTCFLNTLFCNIYLSLPYLTRKSLQRTSCHST